MITETTVSTAQRRAARQQVGEPRRLARAASVGVASVWLLHGLYHKLLHGSPRHLAIVQSVPGLDGIAGERALAAVGLAEVALALWIVSGVAPYLCAGVQTMALLAMNGLELAFARHLLLWPAGLVPMNLAFLALAWLGADSRAAGTLRARLRRHPLAVRARLQDCLTMTYALPAHVLRPLVPPGLELETFQGHGLVAVALVQTRALRPAWVPRRLGQDFVLAGYRVFTTFHRSDGRTIRGLYILRSDANRVAMVAGGNLLTHYKYRLADARFDLVGDRLDVTIRTRDATGDLAVTAALGEASLPSGSPFSSIREARRFAGPLPFTFDYEQETHSIIAVNGTRTNWQPVPVRVDVGRIAFFDQPVFRGCRPVLAAAFHVKDVEYRWARGIVYPLSRESAKR